MRWNAFWKILRRNWRAAIYLFVLAALAVLLVVVCVRRGQTAAQPEPTRLLSISYAVFCLKKKKNNTSHI